MAIDLKQTETPKNVLLKPGLQKREITRQNTSFSKAFLNPTGTFTTEVSSTPVNYKNKSGNWRTVDNTLIAKTENGYDYENKAKAYRVQFARNNINGKLARLEIDPDRWIAFTPVDRFTQLGTIKNSSIVYKNIKQGVDLAYSLAGDSIKEKITLNSPGINQFRFELSYQGIRTVKEADGTIWAVDAATGETLMYFQKSYAEDSKNNITTNISNDIVKEAGKEILVITIDSVWLSKAAYPVVLDPAIVITTVLSDPNNIYDAYIASGYPTNNYYTNSYLHTGYLAGYNTIRSLVKFLYLPSLPPGAKITSAYLDMFMYLGSTGGTTVNVYRIANDWNVTNVNWSNQPAVDSTPVVQNFTFTPNTEWQMDITSAVQAWYSGSTPNYGLMLRAFNEANPKISFFSSNAAGNPTPKLIINYEIDALGAEPYFGFHGNVNVYNGNLVLTDTDVALPGRGNPISIQRAYNLRSDTSSPIGDRWTLNVYMKLSFSDGEIVKLTDSDGTVKYFTKGPDNFYRSPIGVTDTLLNENGVYILEELSGIRYTFTGDGRLDKITDTNGNITDILYLADANINKIVDPSGREVVFNYSGGKLNSITGNEIPTVEYTYTGNNLTRAAVKDTAGTLLTETLYSYDDINKKITVTDALGNATDIIYTTVSGRQVSTITEKLTIDSVLQTLTTSYTYQPDTSGMMTTVTDPMNKITEYTTNNMGNVTKIIEDKGGLNITTQFEWDELQNMVEVTDPKGAVDPDPAKYKTVLDYNEKGDIKRITNPQGYNTIYDYNTKSDPTEVIDFGKKPNINSYDPGTRNLLAASDPLFSTNVMQYDSYGNVITQTNPIGIGDNRIINSGFEAWSEVPPPSSGYLPTGWTAYSLGGSINDDISEKVNGDHSVRLESPGDQSEQYTTILSDFIEVKELVRYNVSWYVKTENAQMDYGLATADIH